MRYIVLSAGHEWNDYCWEKPIEKGEVDYFSKFLPRFLLRLWVHKPLRVNLLLYVLWYPYIKKRLSIKYCEPTVLIVYDGCSLTLSPWIFKRLKREYPNLSIVYCYTNISKISGSRGFGVFESLKDTYDIVFAFDQIDVKQYGFEYYRLVYEPSSKQHLSTQIEYDLFYVGQAKDRYNKLIEIFNKAESEGLKCKFFITGVSEKEMYSHPDITYNHQLPYADVLAYINKSKCLVDAIQGESTGMTIKTSESVVLGKKLITTNKHVTEEPYYKSDNILVYSNESDLKGFLNRPFVVYKDDDKYWFSHKRLFCQINKILDLQH